MWKISFFFLHLCLWSTAYHIRQAVYPGDVILIGLFPIHKNGGGGGSSGDDICGVINMDEGLTLMEYMFYVLDEINGKDILPFALGAVGLDSCDNPSYTLAQCLNFLQFLVTKDFETRGTDESFGVKHYGKIVGLVGTYPNDVTHKAASLLQLFQLPQVISCASTTADLSGKNTNSYLFSTVPSDSSQLKALTEVLCKFGWRYISLVYEDTKFGTQRAKIFMEFTAHHNICLAEKLRVPSDEVDYNYYRDLIHRLRGRNVRIVILLYLNSESVKSLFLAARHLGVEDYFIWIGSPNDGWSARLNNYGGLESVAKHSLTLHPVLNDMLKFRQHLQSVMDEGDLRRNPWLEEFIQATNNSITIADEQELFGHVRDAVYAFAYALRDYYAIWCQDRKLFCGRMEARDIDGHVLRDFLKNVSFEGLKGHIFIFTNGLDATAHYELMTYDEMNGTYGWTGIGYYEGKEGVERAVTFTDKARKERYEQIRSVCSAPCGTGEAKVSLRRNDCCWLCVRCTENQYLEREDKCTDCPPGEIPMADKSSCFPVA